MIINMMASFFPSLNFLLKKKRTITDTRNKKGISQRKRLLLTWRVEMIAPPAKGTNKSKILLPIRLPIERLTAFFLIAPIERANSGKLVHRPTIKIPIKDCATHQDSASSTAFVTTRLDAMIKMINPMII